MFLSSEAFAVAKIDVEVFWVVIMYSAVRCQCSRGPCCLHLPTTTLHSVTTQKTLSLAQCLYFISEFIQIFTRWWCVFHRCKFKNIL